MNHGDALALVRESAEAVIPGAHDIQADAPMRDTLEMDSLDFLEFVEVLGTKSGAQIGEPRLRRRRHTRGFRRSSWWL
ncbi:acyl carrier protein [Yinghuangia aomiensis]